MQKPICKENDISWYTEERSIKKPYIFTCACVCVCVCVDSYHPTDVCWNCRDQGHKDNVQGHPEFYPQCSIAEFSAFFSLHCCSQTVKEKDIN